MWFTIGIFALLTMSALLLSIARCAVWFIERRDRQRRNRKRPGSAIVQ